MADPALHSFLDQDYTSVYAYAGVEAIRARLVKEGAIVVWNEDDTFLGILTPADVVIRSHRLVVDCLRHKPVIRSDESVLDALRTLVDSREVVLPVVSADGQFAGLLHQRTLVEQLLLQKPPRDPIPTIQPLR
ncbi:MAG: CBS domain-containing protein [Tunicatimonas sp.]